ncbi:hypothetical protein ACXYTP_14780 [Tsukamurella ocularis]|uniref:hypothetical protein n=1 Tax=Tsukamurella ocularis TaxID=1970234 RepID=UPI0039F099B4
MSDLQPLLTAQIIPPERASDYLRAMDIEVEDLYAAVAEGVRCAEELDHFAPPTAPGLVRWIGVVAALRRRLAATERWFPDDRRGQPISRHIESRRTLAVMSGDWATGSPLSAFGPHTARRKGRATADSFRPDEVLFPLSDFGPVPQADGALSGTWVLLYRTDGEAIHLEVSQPAGFDSDAGQFTGWAVRVILDDWWPGERRPVSGLGAAVDLQLVRSVA